jgi:hypothetical protein
VEGTSRISLLHSRSISRKSLESGRRSEDKKERVKDVELKWQEYTAQQYDTRQML